MNKQKTLLRLRRENFQLEFDKFVSQNKNKKLNMKKLNLSGINLMNEDKKRNPPKTSNVKKSTKTTSINSSSLFFGNNEKETSYIQKIDVEINSDKHNGNSFLFRKFKTIELRKLILEFLANVILEMFLVLLMLNDKLKNSMTYSIVYGFLFSILFYLIQDESGAQINPSISLAIWVSRFDSKFMINPLTNSTTNKKKNATSSSIIPLTNFSRQLMYILFQFFGTLIGHFIGYILSPSYKSLSITIPQNMDSIGTLKIFIIECVSSIIIILTYLSTNTNNKTQKSLFMGISIFIVSLVIHPLTGGSLNPFRWISSLIIDTPDIQIAKLTWAYLISHLISSIVAPLINIILKM